MKNRYAACVILYKPDMSVYFNIKSYIKDVEQLYVINNDKFENIILKDKLLTLVNVKYINLMDSKGLAYALNIGCKLAIKDGYDYILTMDQDSIFKENSVKTLINFIEESSEEYGIVGSNAYALYKNDKTQKESVSYIELTNGNKICDWVMTSGSMMNLIAYKKTNGFDDSMFIAHLDIEMGIQLHINGYKIIKLKDAVLYQHFGNSKPVKFLWKTVHPSFDSPERMYYLFRNQKYVKMKYPKNRKMIGVSLWKYLIKVLCYEDEKIEKMKMACRGYIDAKKKKMGKLKL